MRVFAEAGIPVGICAMPLAAASAPLSIAGMLAMANAEILSGIAILQTLAPGTPTMHISYAATIDLSSGGINTAWAGEEVFSAMANTQLARRYEIPYSVWAFAPEPSAPTGRRACRRGCRAWRSRSPGHLINGAGSLYDDVVYSPVELVLDAELFEMLVRFAEGFPFAAEDAAVDTIAEVGPGGHFLDRPHTLANMRAFWRERDGPLVVGGVETAGRPDPTVAATERPSAAREPRAGAARRGRRARVGPDRPGVRAPGARRGSLTGREPDAAARRRTVHRPCGQHARRTVLRRRCSRC